MENALKYEGSELWKNVEYANDIEQLSSMAHYIDGAVMYWSGIGDKEQLDFFLSAQEHWKTKVKVKVRKTNARSNQE